MLGLIATGDRQIARSLESRALQMENLSTRLEKASDLIYEDTQHRFDTEADGEWPPLSESTVAKKASQGYGEPARALYATGDLYESATSPHGPFSQRILVRNATEQQIIMLVDWDSDGWQIPVLLSEGDERLPARPIWPPADQMADRVRAILMVGL